MDATLVIAAAAAVVTGAIYAYVGHRLRQRKVEGEARVAHLAFLAWWFGLAANQFITATQTIAFQAGVLPVGLYQAVGQLSLLIIIVALWGLLYYLVFLYTGSSRALVPLAIFYGIFFLVLLISGMAGPQPAALGHDGWDIVALDAQGQELQIYQGATLIALVIFLLGPQIGAAIAFLRLYPKVDDPTQKFRILLVSLSILAWFGVPVVALIVGGSILEADAYAVFTRVLAIAAALTILLAYLPPEALRKRYGLRSIAEES